MYTKWIFAAVVLVGLLLLGEPTEGGWASTPLDAPNNAQPADNPWKIEVVETGDYQQFQEGRLSMTFAADTGYPFVSYYAKEDQDLRLAVRSPYGDRCTSGGDWTCEAVDTPGDVGRNSSVATYYNPSFTKYGIAYHDETNLTVKVAIQTCFSLLGCSDWDISTIDDLRSQGETHPSLAFDSNGKPCLTYHQSDTVFSQDDIVYAHYVGSGGNCGQGAASGEWECESDTAAISQYANTDTSLALTGDDDPFVAYLSHGDSGDTLRLCQINIGYLWTCETIDDVSNKSSFVSLALDQDNHAHIAYSSQGTGGVLKLRYAHYVGSGGNCGASGDYQCDTIADDIGSYDGPLDMALDESDLPVIAYHDIGVMIARPLGAYNTLVGNCGPRIGVFHTWVCTTIDNLTAGLTGENLAVATDRNGLVAVAYSLYDYDTDRSWITVARQYYPVYLPLILH